MLGIIKGMKKGFSIALLVAVFGLAGLVIFFNYDSIVSQYQSSTIKDLLAEAQAQAKVYYESQNPKGYTASTMLTPSLSCTGDMFSGNFANNLDAITGSTSAWPKGTTLSCQATALQYAISASLPVGDGEDESLSVWCVDSTGRATWIDYPLVPGDTNCN